jgi:hypothetical protein
MGVVPVRLPNRERTLRLVRGATRLPEIDVPSAPHQRDHRPPRVIHRTPFSQSLRRGDVLLANFFFSVTFTDTVQLSASVRVVPRHTPAYTVPYRHALLASRRSAQARRPRVYRPIRQVQRPRPAHLHLESPVQSADFVRNGQLGIAATQRLVNRVVEDVLLAFVVFDVHQFAVKAVNVASVAGDLRGGGAGREDGPSVAETSGEGLREAGKVAVFGFAPADHHWAAREVAEFRRHRSVGKLLLHFGTFILRLFAEAPLQGVNVRFGGFFFIAHFSGIGPGLWL